MNEELKIPTESIEFKSYLKDVGEFSIFTTDYSDWECYLFGMGKNGMIITPQKGKVPNRFWRFMQYVCFGNEWVKVR